MKDLKKSDIITVLLCLCGIIPGAVMYDKLPDRIVTNWSFYNSENDTNSKAFVVFGMPLIFAAISLICLIYIRKLEKKGRSGKLSSLFVISFPVMFYICQGTILLYALGRLKDIRLLICVICSASLIAIGNYMPKIRKNWIIGIRTPHTLTDEETWYRTHRFAGFIVTACGIAALIVSLLGYFIAALIILTASVIIPMIYAEVTYYLNRKKKGEEKP